MKAVILAGGQGSRLRPLTENLPKPMISVFGKPIMEHITGHLVAHGVQEIVTTLHYRPRVIRDHFGDGSDFGFTMHYTLEKEPLGTAGSVKLGTPYLDETFLVAGGDALVDFDFNQFLEFHRKKGAKVSLCLVRVRDPSEFGIVITDENGAVQRFLEKPGPSEVFSDTVNTGIYLIEPEVLDYIPEGEDYDFAGDLFPKLLQDGVPIFGYVAQGYWSDIGTLDQLRQAHWDFLDGKVKLPLDGNQISEGVWIGEGVDMAPDISITPPCWLGNGVQVHAGAKLGPYVMLGDNVEVDDHAMIGRSIVMRNCFVGESADLRNCIVAPRNIIEAECELGNECVIGAGGHLGQRVVVKPGVMIWPDKKVDIGATVTENLVWESLTRPSIFGSRGISGLGNLWVTPEFAVVVGKALGTWIKQGGRVVVSRDRHPFSRLIKRALVSGLLAVGVDVDDLEESSAPVTRFCAGYGRGIDGGVHLRVSEEHPEVAQIELFESHGLPLTRSSRRKVEATFYRADYPKVAMRHVGHLRYPGRVSERYLDSLIPCLDLPSIGRIQRQTVCCIEGSVSIRILDEIFRRSGISYLRVGGGGDPDINIESARKIVKLNHSLGFVMNAGSERLQLIDEDGEILDYERSEHLLIAAFILGAPERLPVFLSTGHPAFLYELAREQHREVVVTRVEAAARLAEIREQTKGTLEWFEFEHFYLGYDALSACCRLLEFLGKYGMLLRDLHRRVPRSFEHHFNVACPWEEMGRVMRTLSDREEADMEGVPEGVRLSMHSGSAFILPSADQPEVMVSLEATDASSLGTLTDEMKHMLLNIIG